MYVSIHIRTPATRLLSVTSAGGRTLTAGSLCQIQFMRGLALIAASARTRARARGRARALVTGEN